MADDAKDADARNDEDQVSEDVKRLEEEDEQEGDVEEAEKPDRDEDTFDEKRAREALAKKNREAKNLRKRLKELEPLAEKAKQLEDANKSESEKLTEKVTSAEKRAVEAEQELARLRVALKKGLTDTQAKRLVGESEEELEADADELLAEFQPKEAEDEDEEEDQESTSQRRPKERLRPGAAPSAEPEVRGPKELADRVSRDW